MNVAATRFLAGAAVAVVLTACGGGGATPSPSAPATGGLSSPETSPPSASPAASATQAPASPSPSLAPSRPPSAVAVAAPPAVETFWDAVRRGIATAGHLRIRVIGPSPGVLRYEPGASATVVDDRVGFVCVDGAAWDGQGGSFAPVPGTWECGAAALVGGFRNTGQPVDAWGETLPTDASISETTAREPDGRWRWDYAAKSAVFGGRVTASVWVDPASGRILDARRTDPGGSTSYGISYAEAFPAITRP